MPFKLNVPTICAQCGTSFMAARPARTRPAAKYCGHECAKESLAKPLAEKFWAGVDRADGCWPWNKCASSAGYGQINHRGNVLYAHRVSWELHIGPVPDGMEVCHRCDNPPCCNPEHLFLGTHGDNMRDMFSKDRRDNRKVASIGTAHHRTRLTDADVINIRRRGASGENHRAIAASFQMSRPAITAIIGRRTWARLR